MVSGESPTLNCQTGVKHRGRDWEVVAEAASEDRSPAADAQSSAAVEGTGGKGLGTGAMAGLGTGAFGHDIQAECLRQRCFSVLGNLVCRRGLDRLECSVKLRPDHEIGLNMSSLAERRLGFRVLPVRSREAGP